MNEHTDKVVVMSFKVPGAVRDALREVARVRGVPMSELVRSGLVLAAGVGVVQNEKPGGGS